MSNLPDLEIATVAPGVAWGFFNSCKAGIRTTPHGTTSPTPYPAFLVGEKRLHVATIRSQGHHQDHHPVKRHLQFLVQVSAVSVFAFSTGAQDPTRPQAIRPDQWQHDTGQERRADRLNGAAKASDLIGITVNNYQNEKLGAVGTLRWTWNPAASSR